MVNLSKTILNAFITAVFGLSLTIFSAYFIDRQQALFWTLIVAIWIIAGIINGFILKEWKEVLISGGIISGTIFIVVSLFTIILKIFSEAMIEYFSGLDLFQDENIFGISFLIGFLFALGSGITFTGSAIATLYSIISFKKSKGIQSTQNYESELFEQYETPDDAGEYISSEDKEEI